MVFKCCFCAVEAESVSALCTHVRISHACNALTVFSCKQEGCSREYDTLRSLRKHLNQKHATQPPGIQLERIAALPEGGDNVQNEMNIEVQNDDLQGHVPDNAVHEENENVTVLEFQNILMKSSLALAAKLYAAPSLNRAQVQNILDQVRDFSSSEYLEVLKNKTESLLRTSNIPDDEQADLLEMFDAMRNMFQGVETECQRVNAFKQSGVFMSPESYVIGVGEKMKTIEGNRVLSQVELTGQFIPMRQVLKKYLELPGVYSAVMRNVQDLKQSDDFTNFIQGSLWHHTEQTHFVNKTVLPLHLYYDDVEPDNMGGSHSGDHKLGAVYYHIPCIPQHLLSTLDEIFLAAVFLSDDRGLNNGAAFAPIIRELIDLETNGIVIETETGEHKVYFALGLLLGDNLAQHSITGFVESFSANFYCRFCREHRDTMRYQLRENALQLRNELNYQIDLATNNPALTGIKWRCIWNVLRSYFVTSNLTADIMHDLYEGVCHYVLTKILHHLIFVMRYFSIDTLNERVQNFDYGKDIGNKPTTIKEDHLRNEKMKMSASEMMFFVSHVGVMIGDLVPEADECWPLYVKLIAILDVIKAPYVRREQTEYLSTLISEHHDLYCRLFNTHLKPKFHFMVHYPNLMLAVGPLVHIWSMRMEGKHRPVIKIVASNMSNRQNLPLTVAKKYVFSLCARFLERKGYRKETKYFSIQQRIVNCDDFHEFQNVLPHGRENSFVVKEAEICGTNYKQNMIVVINYEDDQPLFGKIKWIVEPQAPNVSAAFILSGYNTVGFDEHRHCYHIQPSPEWFYFEYTDLISFHTCVARTAIDGESYVTFPYML